MIRSLLVLTGLAAGFIPAGAFAQFQIPTGQIASFPLDELPSSSRCLALAGACTALAGGLDEAVTNPAALGGMEKLQFSAQIRYSEIDALFLDQDAVDSERFGPAAGQLYKFFKETNTDLGYAGVGRSFGDWSVAAHYRKQLQFSGAFMDEEVFDLPNNQVFANFNALTASMESVGVTASYRFSPQWSAGVSISNASLDVDSNDFWQQRSVTGGVTPATGFNSVLVGNRIDDEDSDTVIAAGLIYQPDERFSFGLAYRQGGDFALDSDAVNEFQLNGGTTRTSQRRQALIELPDTVSLGAAWRPGETWLLVAAVDHIGYSNLPAVRNQTLGYGINVDNLLESIDDTTSYRLGLEKVFPRRSSEGLLGNYTLRAGMFSEEDHDGIDIAEGFDIHYTIGFGVDLGPLTLDLGLEFGDEDKNYILSLRY